MPLSFGFAKGQVIATRVQSPMILEIDTTQSAGTTYDINFFTPSGGVSPNYTIDWGDGTVQNFTTVGIKSRTYASAGTYQIKISGAVGGIGWGYNVSNLTNNNKLTKIIDFGNITRLTSLSGLANQSRLTAIATNLPSTVTDISSFFLRASTFNLDVSAWNTSNITNMGNTFAQASVFNQNIGAWDVSKVTDMQAMFASATAFNNGGSDSIKNWNTAACTNMQYMFYQALAFNQPIGTWNTGNVNRMIYMFGSDVAGMTFNQNIGAWNVSKNQFFSQMFYGNTAFNNGGSPDINNWTLYSGGGTIDFFRMFMNATGFNQPIGNWNVSRVLSMSQAFQGCSSFNQNIGAWNPAICNNLSYTFANCVVFNNGGSDTIKNWNTSTVTNMNATFAGAYVFNQPIGSWNTANVTSFNSMFANARAFNQPLNTWNTGNALDIRNMFDGAWAFNQNIGAWNLSKCTGMNTMFRGALAFNNGGSPDINNWDTSKVTSPAFRDMFQGATSFNQPIANWSWASASGDSDRMFKGATAFNQPLPNWNFGNTTSLSEMFQNATAFNQNIGSWNLSKVTTLTYTFAGATAFNNGGSSDINNLTLNTTAGANVNVYGMFENATAFNQSIGGWNISRLTTMNNLLNNCGMSYENYSKTLVGWANYVASTGLATGRTLGATGRKYTGSKYSAGTYQNAKTARTYLTTATGSGGAGWTISDAGDALMMLHFDPSNAFSYPGTGTTITDLTDQGNTGTLANGASVSNGVLVFDGSNDMINIPHTSSLNLGQTFAVGVWVKANALGSTLNSNDIGNRQILYTTRYANPAGCWQLELNANSISVTGVGTFVVTAGTIAANTWYYIAYVRNGSGSGTIYINGVAQTPTTTTAYTFTDNSDIKQIGSGGSTGTGQPFNGSIGNIHLYKTAPSAQDLLQHFNATRSQFGV